MSNIIGLLVVHGIGQQSRDDLGRVMSARLADSVSVQVEATHRITVQGVPVHVAEAYWADISDPDNVPELRVGSGVLPEFFDTVSVAWYSILSRFSSQQINFAHAKRDLILVGLLGLFAMLGIVFLVHSYPQAMLIKWSTEAQRYLIPLLGFLMIYKTYQYARDQMRTRLLDVPDGQPLRRALLSLLWFPLLLLIGYARFLTLLMLMTVTAELLLFQLLACLLVLLINYLLVFPVLLIQDVSELLMRMQWLRLRCWLHRITWVMIVLPMHSLLQGVKSLGNLFSILFTCRTLSVRLIALAGLFGVYLGFIVLMFFTELLIIPGIIPFVPDYEAEAISVVSQHPIVSLLVLVMWIGFYLVYIKFLLPTIDLVLDVGNYHLANEKERSSYFHSIEEGVANLIDSGVNEIHILAHSLGTVISYDWLQSRQDESVPVTVLHTLGSPLDKFWYIDHTRQRRQADDQGLPAKRLVSWTNYWAWSDPVSGNLDHYQLSNRTIINHRMRWLGACCVSHVAYWKNESVIEGVRARIGERGNKSE